MSNLPTQLINFPWIFLYRFLSCMDGGYLSYLLRNFLIQKFYWKKKQFQCIYGCYVHSAILPTFHRRCYWLLQVGLTNNQQIYFTGFLHFYFSPPESWHCPGSLPQCSLPWRQQDAGDQLRGPVGREEGVDQGGAGITAEANVWVVSLIFLMFTQTGQASPLRL